jgi:NAD(P)-dependent dehydrogenase (short-subunit alcohol dehydrogenase family)
VSPGVSTAVRTTRPTAAVTSAVDGLGAEVALLLARRGYDLVLLVRSRERTHTLLDGLTTEVGDVAVEIVEVDQADQDSSVKAARHVLNDHPRIDVLFNNAGVLLDGHNVSSHHNELHFQVNTLAPYMQMRLLRPALATALGGRVMNVASGSIPFTGRLRIDGLRSLRTRRKLVGPYACRAKRVRRIAIFDWRESHTLNDRQSTIIEELE